MSRDTSHPPVLFDWDSLTATTLRFIFVRRQVFIRTLLNQSAGFAPATTKTSLILVCLRRPDGTVSPIQQFLS